MGNKSGKEDQVGTVAVLTAAMLASALGVTVLGARATRCAGAPASVRLRNVKNAPAANGQPASTAGSVAAGETDVEESGDGK